MRFRFTGDWLNDVFQNIVVNRKEKYNPLTSKEQFPCIELDSLSQNTGELLTTYDSRNQKSIKTKFYTNDVLYGKLRPYLRKYYRPMFEGVCSSEIWVLTSNVLDSSFLYQYIQTNSFNELANISSGSKMPRADWSVISDSLVYYPDLIEMIKIGKFLLLLDQRIHTQIKIIKDYHTYKNTLIDELIYKNPDCKVKVPLKEYAILKTGYAFKSSKYDENGKHHIITIANVTGEKYINASSCNKVAYLPNDLQNHQVLKRNDILISLTGNVGRVSIVNTDSCLLNQRVGVLSFKEPATKEYIYQVLSSCRFENQMIQKGQGAAQKNISNDDVESFLIPLPLKENNRNLITQYLNLVDKKIAIETTILNDYILEKNYLLKNMFI